MPFFDLYADAGPANSMISSETFQRWLASAPRRPEIMTGVRSFAATATGSDLAKAQARPSYGGYGEDRSVYTQTLFAPEDEEPRTVHLGLDIFAPAGTAVFTPLPAHVHSSRINDNPGDYGPTIILEHAIDGGAFYTLYGHLSRESLKGLKPGAAFMAGEQIVSLGTRNENGGWPPHLHFQVILDLKGKRGDYPGVCKRSEREHWLALCPDPRPLLGLA
jgi:murein DD-endopeptidase MepM/ murein hydrolase activator NlpD